ncbi:MAG: chemotaxis protein CheA [Chitinispirillaceae bacterium]
MNVEQWLNKAMSHLPLVDNQDLSVLASVVSDLEQAGECPDSTPALRGQLKKTCALAENMILGEADFDSGIERLFQSVSKMLETSEAGSEENGTGEPESEEINSELKELRKRFAESQEQTLEDFEAVVLNIDKDTGTESETIKRMLHTWKGEFGVLECAQVSSLIHDLEEKIDDGVVQIDALLRFKDFIHDQLAVLSQGEEVFVPEEVELSVLSLNSQEQEQATDNTCSQARCIEADPSLLNDFVVESRDHIQEAESVLLELESDSRNSDHLNSVFRACHTIKGVAGFIGLNEIADLSHSVENLMDQARKGELLITADHIDVIFQALDCLKECITAVEECIGGADFVGPESYPSVMKLLSSPIANKKEKNDEEEGKKVGEILVEQGSATNEDVDSALELQAQGDNRKVGEILHSEKKVAARDIKEALTAQSSAKNYHVEDTIRVPVNRLDQLIDATGEAVIAQSMITADPTIQTAGDQMLNTKLTRTNLIMRKVQELSMSLRMISVKPVFQKMVRLVRDLSKKSKKQVDLVLEGEDTEIDKSVVENIGDPLMHMIRNSVDHGIETPQERKEKGKPEKGTVVLRAYHKAGNVFIEIEDDGKGLDRDVIVEKAISKGICTSADNLSDAEVYQFIFQPGFSTAKAVTDISGRGVGMDVVKKNIESLRGAVEISSRPGKGTTFTIRLPLTLAIIDGMVVRSGESKYIVPTLSILETMAIDDDNMVSVLNKKEMVKVRENFIPVVRLSSVFDERETKDSGFIAIILEDMMNHQMGLIVNEIIGQQQVVIKSLGSGIGEIPGVSGGAILSDGNVSLILDVGGLIKVAQNNS